MTDKQAFADCGFALIDQAVSPDQLEQLREEADRLFADSPQRGGFRHGIQRSPMLRALGDSPPLRQLVSPLIGEAARAVKLTGFDKTPQANWNVPWHQDLTITVRDQRDVPGFGPWTMKGGLPDSHRLGKLPAEGVQQCAKQQEEASCPLAAGGAMLMSPLLIHASSQATAPGRRRVLHFEYTATDLPGGLQWA